MIIEIAVAGGLAHLLAQRQHLRFQCHHNIIKAFKIGFGTAQPQFGLMAAGMEAGYAGGLFEQLAALGWFGGNDFADLALANQRRRAGATSGIGK